MSFFHRNTTLNCSGRLLLLDEPKIMGILNLTPDSFYDGGKFNSGDAYLHLVEKMLNEGADIIDVGGMSSRPGASIIPVEEELRRIIEPIKSIIKRFPDLILSIDTVHSKVVLNAVENGALIVNDISAGQIDAKMFNTVASLNVPYILMHMKGRPDNMQNSPEYENISLEILDFFIHKMKLCRAAGIKDIIIDPGFGFGKSLSHNFELLNNLRDLEMLELPILIGISRKSMITQQLKIQNSESLNGTTALHMIALNNGANILRVHDVKEAKQCVELWKALKEK